MEITHIDKMFIIVYSGETNDKNFTKNDFSISVWGQLEMLHHIKLAFVHISAAQWIFISIH